MTPLSKIKNTKRALAGNSTLVIENKKYTIKLYQKNKLNISGIDNIWSDDTCREPKEIAILAHELEISTKALLYVNGGLGRIFASEMLFLKRE